VLDSAAGYAYFGAESGHIVKVGTSAAGSVLVGTLASLQPLLYAAAIDPGGSRAYFASFSDASHGKNGIVAVLDLSTFQMATPISCHLANAEYYSLRSVAVDAARGYLYAGANPDSGRHIIRVRLSDGLVTGVAVSSGLGLLYAAVVDAGGDALYVSAGGTPSTLLQLALMASFPGTPASTLALQTSPVSSFPGLVHNGSLFLGTRTSPGQVLRVAVDTLTEVTPAPTPSATATPSPSSTRSASCSLTPSAKGTSSTASAATATPSLAPSQASTAIDSPSPTPSATQNHTPPESRVPLSASSTGSGVPSASRTSPISATSSSTPSGSKAPPTTSTATATSSLTPSPSASNGARVVTGGNGAGGDDMIIAEASVNAANVAVPVAAGAALAAAAAALYHWNKHRKEFSLLPLAERVRHLLRLDSSGTAAEFSAFMAALQEHVATGYDRVLAQARTPAERDTLARIIVAAMEAPLHTAQPEMCGAGGFSESTRILQLSLLVPAPALLPACCTRRRTLSFTRVMAAVPAVAAAVAAAINAAPDLRRSVQREGADTDADTAAGASQSVSSTCSDCSPVTVSVNPQAPALTVARSTARANAAPVAPAAPLPPRRVDPAVAMVATAAATRAAAGTAAGAEFS
jgi:hypothetical protein